MDKAYCKLGRDNLAIVFPPGPILLHQSFDQAERDRLLHPGPENEMQKLFKIKAPLQRGRRWDGLRWFVILIA